MLVFDMGTYSAGTVATGSSGTVTLTLQNSGAQDSGPLPALAVTGDASLAVVAGGTCAQGNVVAGGGSCTIVVRFQPPGYGSRSGAISVTASPGGTASATVGGTGQQTFTLTVNKTGSTGTGSVTSTPAGDINCDLANTKCSNAYTVTASAPMVTLHATPGGTSTFTGWSSANDCAGAGTGDCQLALSTNRTATAVFAARYTLTVSFAGSAAGTVVIQPGGQTCTSPTACTATFDAGANVTLTAKPSNGSAVTSVLSGWTGACAGNGPYRFCTLTMNADTSTAARFDRLPANLVFATSSSFAGNLGSAAMYQAQCNQLATAAGINTTTNDAYVVWMAASNYAPVSLLGTSRGWVRADLMPWIDVMSTALSTGNVWYPVAYDENGQRIIATTLAGMSQTGAVSTGLNCSDWTDATVNSSHGSTHAAGRGWTYNNVGVSSCENPNHLICVMKGANVQVTVPAIAGKRIYISKAPWVPAGGVSAADSRCLGDAPTGVTNAKAVLVASTRALSDVLGAATVYVRPDGVRVGTGAEIISAMNNGTAPASIESPVTQDGGGAYVDVGNVQGLWTGLTYNGTTDKDTCRDWTSSATSDSGTMGGPADGWEFAGKDGSFACNNSFGGRGIVYLQCAEQ
jgi:hypothetical protein